MIGIAPSGDGKAATRLRSRHNREGRAQAQPIQHCQEVRLSAFSPATKARQERERAPQMRREPLRRLIPPCLDARIAMTKT
jgi:hypothetical protein